MTAGANLRISRFLSPDGDMISKYSGLQGEPAMPPKNSNDTVGPTLKAAVIAGSFGNALVIIYALTQKSPSAYAVATLASIAAGAIGGAGGFLFALPRYAPEVQGPNSAGQEQAQPHPDREGAQAPHKRSFIPSNSLIQIADWFTKLLIGAGLVQLGTIGHGLGGLIGFIASGISDANPVPDSAKVVAGSVIVFNSVLSFLFFYGNTSLSYQQLLDKQAEESAGSRPARIVRDGRTSSDRAQR